MAAEEQPLKPFKEKPKKRTLFETIRNIQENITVEPVLACYVVPNVLSRLATQNLNLDKACRVNKKYGDLVCDALIAREGDKYLKEELAVQELIAGMESWKNVLLTAIPSLLILFIGAWSDRTGKRKICILLPIVGELLVCISNILNAYYFYELPVEVTMFFEAFFPAITGGWITTYMGAFSYISDVSSEESRTFRVGVANLCLTAGTPIGSVLSGVLLNHIGYYGVFTLSCILYIFSILYGFLYIKDPERPVAEKNDKKESSGLRGFLKSFFDMKHVKDTLTVAFKKGPNHRRAKSVLVLASIAFIYGAAYGEFTVRYLFCRYRFNWDAMKYSLYSTFYILIHLLAIFTAYGILLWGMAADIETIYILQKRAVLAVHNLRARAFVSITFFSRHLKWDDSVLGLISNFSKIMGSIATGLARNTTEMYIAVAIEMFNASSFTALRSISSKLVSSDELGKMTSVFNLMEVLTSMVFGPIYSWIYMFTVQLDAGIIYYVSTTLTVPALAVFVWFFIQHRKRSHQLTSYITDGAQESENESKEKEKPSEPTVKIRKNSLLSSIDLADERVFID